jgi:RNAse (barnase) inhibitor barstar
MEEHIGKYVLRSATEEEIKKVMADRKSRELGLLWDILHGDDGEPLTEAHRELWVKICNSAKV